jgi:hypothetical protein
MQLKDSLQPVRARRYAAWRLVALVGSSVLASTFAAPAQAQRVLPTDLTNIAAAASGGKIVNVTSTLDNDATLNANNLIDGKVWDGAQKSGTQGWASNKFDPVNMDSVTIGFAGNGIKRIGKLIINPTSAVAPERWAKDIEVQVSTGTAEGPFRPIAQLTLRKAAEPQEFLVLPAEARFVRLMFRSNWGSDRAVSLGEVEIYEAITNVDPMFQIISQLEGAINDLRRYQQTQIDLGSTGNGARRSATADESTLALAPATLQLIQMTTGGNAPRLPVSNVNVAAAANGGKIVDSSSTFISDPAKGADPAFAPEKLIDGKNFTGKETDSFGWSSQGFAPGRQWVTIGFRDDRPKVVAKFVLNPTSNQSDLRWARRVDVQVTNASAKNGPWRTVTTLNLRPEATNQEFTMRPVEAKYVRFVFMANGPGGISLPNADPDVNSDRSVSLGEIEIYEASSSSDVLDALISRFTQVLTDLKNIRKQVPVKKTDSDTLELPTTGVQLAKVENS